MPQISRNVPAAARTRAPRHSHSMAGPGWREPPSTSAARARNSSKPASHSAASPPRERRTGKRSDNPSGYQSRAVPPSDMGRRPESGRWSRVVPLEGSILAERFGGRDVWRQSGRGGLESYRWKVQSLRRGLRGAGCTAPERTGRSRVVPLEGSILAERFEGGGMYGPMGGRVVSSRTSRG